MGTKLNRGSGSGDTNSSDAPGNMVSGQGRTTGPSITSDWLSNGWDDPPATSTDNRQSSDPGTAPIQNLETSRYSSGSSSSNVNPWGEPSSSTLPGQLRKKLSFDPGSGVIALPDEDNVWEDMESDGEDDSGEAVSPVSWKTPYGLPRR